MRGVGIAVVLTCSVGCYAGGPSGDGAADESGDDTAGGVDGSGDAPDDGPEDGPGDAPDDGPDDAPDDGPDDAPDDGPGDGSTGEPIDGPLLDRLLVTDVMIGAGVKAGVSNWRIWGTGPLHVAPVFTIPLGSGDTLVGYTTGSGAGIEATVAHLDPDDTLVSELSLASGLELRGLAAESDEVFGALVWDPMAMRIYVRRFDLGGSELSSTELTNPSNTPTEFGIGDSRLEYGDGTYGAYYHVHSDDGHEGDTLKWVDAATGAESTAWPWGCSHSMSNLLRYNAVGGGFMPACVTDCYPGTSGDFATNAIGGIYLDHQGAHVMDVDAGCNGSVAGELGGAALTPSGWALVFNAHQNPATPGQSSYDPGTMNQDIGLSMIGSGMTPGPVVWLTATPGNEDDAAIARWQPADDGAEQYVVGWNAGGQHMLARVDPSGAFLEGPEDITGIASWGRRDDPFRVHANADVVWAWFDDPGATTLHVARLRSGT